MHFQAVKWTSTEKQPIFIISIRVTAFQYLETALMKIYNDVLEDLTRRSDVTMTFLDFSTAFDTVDHNLLIRRLKAEHGVGGVLLIGLKHI